MYWIVTAHCSLPSRPELDGPGQGGDLFVHHRGPVRLRRRLAPGDGVGGEHPLRRELAPVALDHHGAGQGDLAVDVAQGEVEAVLEAFVVVIPFRMEGLGAGVAVDGAQADEPGGELPDLVVAVTAPHGLVRHHQFIGLGALPPPQEDHGFALVAGEDRPEEGQAFQQQPGGEGRGVDAHPGLLGPEPGDARRRHHGLKKRGALHQEKPVATQQVVDGVIGRRKILVFEVDG